MKWTPVRGWGHGEGDPPSKGELAVHLVGHGFSVVFVPDDGGMAWLSADALTVDPTTGNLTLHQRHSEWELANDTSRDERVVFAPSKPPKRL